MAISQTRLMLKTQLEGLATRMQEMSYVAMDSASKAAHLAALIVRMRQEAGLRDNEEFVEYPLAVGPLQVGMEYAETGYTEDGRPKGEKWHLQCLACEVAWVEDPDVETSTCWLCEKTFSVPLTRQRYDAHCEHRLDAAF